MAQYAASTAEICRDLLGHCAACYGEAVSDAGRVDQLNLLARSVSKLERFVRGYENIKDPFVNTTDEILNWTFSETAADLCGAIWLLASGFYKASASSLRNAFDIAVASLYFQIRENFSEWDAGKRDTPNWGEMKQLIGTQPSVARFNLSSGIDIVDEAHRHFRYLCAYTHTSAYARNGDPVTAINTTGSAPAFEEEYFLRGCTMASRTISLIAILWQVTYPQIATTFPLGPLGDQSYRELFPAPFGPLALAHQ